VGLAPVLLRVAPLPQPRVDSKAVTNPPVPTRQPRGRCFLTPLCRQVCVPTADSIDGLPVNTRRASDADITALHELHLQSRAANDKVEAEEAVAPVQPAAGGAPHTPPTPGSGAVPRVKGLYETLDLGKMKCSNFTMHAGDRLYMPYGTLHRAVTGAAGSAHITIGFPRDGSQRAVKHKKRAWLIFLISLASPHVLYAPHGPGSVRVRRSKRNRIDPHSSNI